MVVGFKMDLGGNSANIGISSNWKLRFEIFDKSEVFSIWLKLVCESLNLGC